MKELQELMNEHPDLSWASFCQLFRARWMLIWTVAALFCAAGLPTDAAQFTRELSLTPGWNSVWLDVAPVYDTGDSSGLAMAVADVFTDTAITMVAMPVNPAGSSEFIFEATEVAFNQEGWRVWRRAGEFGEDTLTAVNGSAAYLVYVDGAESVTLDITGDVHFQLPTWVPDSYNLLGFNLTSPVLFSDFFASVPGLHAVNKVFRLASDGNWVGIGAGEMMEANEAYWIYADGPSDFAGPVAIRLDGTTGIDFGNLGGDISIQDPQGVSTNDFIFVQKGQITFSNLDSDSHALKITKISPATTAFDAFSDGLRLFELTPKPDALKFQIGPGGLVTVWDIGDLAAETTRTVTLGAHRNWSAGGTLRENLYRIEIDNLYFWLPVEAGNPEASDAVDGDPLAANQGLWIGEVTLDAVSSITEDGAPVRSAAAAAPMRVIIHVSSNGVARLLEHVTIMGTRSASSDVPPELVLVADDEKIPFFEGIEERGGKRVGRRFETVGYDMPRRMDTTTQAALLSEVADAFGYSSITNVGLSNIVLYVNSRPSRPPTLVEDYHLMWPLRGGLGPNEVLRTFDSFVDANGNGIQDDEEPFVDYNSNGVWNAGELFTDSDGNGSWSDLESYFDANSNSVWDAAEPHADSILSNGIWDAAEPYTDSDTNGVWDPAEPLIDSVFSNGIWDAGEPFVDDNTNSVFDPDEPVVDSVFSNGVWDAAEPYDDLNTNGMWDAYEPLWDSVISNGTWDAGEAYVDANGNSEYDAPEPLFDLNSNGVWDAAESFTDANSNAVWDAAEPFSDVVVENGSWNAGEPYTDLNTNGVWDPEEAYTDSNTNGAYDVEEAYTDVNTNSSWDAGEAFTDINSNDVWDDDEVYTDLNSNAVWDAGETFGDMNSNGVWDAAEAYTDLNSNGTWDASEIFTDLNSNGVYNGDEVYADPNSNGVWDAAEPFSDLNQNGSWDDDELYTDSNSNGVWDAQEVFADLDQDGTWDEREAFVDANSNGVWDVTGQGEAFTDTNTNGVWDAAEIVHDLNENGVIDASPLILDPFHRSNPFRHAYHPRHGAGLPLSRSLEIRFDERQTAETLYGDYEEVITGLTAMPLTLTGRIQIKRVSEVGELQ